MLELAYRRHNVLDSDLLPQQGASAFRKRHLRFVPACSKINKNAARQTWGGRDANNEASRKCRDANERCRWRDGVGRAARLAGFGAIADRHRGRGRAGRRAGPVPGRVRVHGRAGRHAGRRPLFLRYPSQSHLPPRYERRDQYRSRADQRRQRPRGDGRGRFAGGGRRRQTDQQTQPRRCTPRSSSRANVRRHAATRRR
jgi:hypothetical protein